MLLWQETASINSESEMVCDPRVPWDGFISRYYCTPKLTIVIKPSAFSSLFLAAGLDTYENLT